MKIDAEFQEVLDKTASRLSVSLELLIAWAQRLDPMNAIESGVVENLLSGSFEIASLNDDQEPLFRLTEKGTDEVKNLLATNRDAQDFLHSALEATRKMGH